MAKRTRKAPVIQPVAPIHPTDQRDFYNVPNSTASNTIMEVLAAGADIANLPDRKKQVNNTSTLEVYESESRRQVVLTSQHSQVTIELADIDKLTGSNKPAKKLFVLALIKANEQSIHDGLLTKNYVTFPLQELIDTGFYKTRQSARRGFNDGMDILTGLKVKGHIQIPKKKGTSIDALEVLFTGARIDRGQCTIFLNERINWSFIAQYFTILPRYYFRLPNRASDLLYYIFYLARQRTRDIEEKGYFTIKFRSIQHRLQLPSEIGNGNPYRTIKEPIDTAIEELETQHSIFYNNTEFRLLPVCNEKAPISEYLDNGYLQVSLSGSFAEAFIELSKNQEKKFEASQARHARIVENAMIKNMAKKLEEKEKPKEGEESGTP